MSGTQEVMLDNAWAGAKIIGKECSTLNKMFFKCKSVDKDPANCAGIGLMLLGCTNDTFGNIKKHCLSENSGYVKCLNDNHNGGAQFQSCRKAQFALEECYDAGMSDEKAAAKKAGPGAAAAKAMKGAMAAMSR